MDNKQILTIAIAIMATGAVLHVASKLPVVDKVAEYITKGYGV